ncbi:MAG: tetratricopeptide repeat protein [Bryobacteraceae bacterium]|jgi:tetratricopeptide (TPR) repeat protein
MISRGALAVIVLPLIVFLAGCRSAQSYLEKGNAMFAQGHFAEANLNYRKALQKDPNFGEAYYRAGLAELKDNKVAQALQDLQRAVRLMPDNQAAKTDLTNLLLGAYIGDSQHPKFLYDLLVQFSGEWLKRDPNSLQGLRIKGYLAMLERRPEEAVAELRRAHQLYPSDEKITDGLMDAFFRAKQPAEAEKVGLDFIGRDPKATDIYDALFRIDVAENRVQDAEDILTRKVNANPKENSYILQLAAFYAGAHRKPEMDRTLQRLLSNPGGSPTVRLEAGDFYTSIGDLADALVQYRAGSSSNKNDSLVYQNRIARVLLLQNNRQEGLKVLNQTLTQHPDDAEARALRAALLVGEPGAGKPGEGIQDLRTLLEKNPNDLFLKFVLARGLAESQNFPEARARLLEIVKLRPQFLEAHLLLADIAFRQQDMLETIQQSEAALEVDPENLRARMLRGSALLQQGNLDQAEAVLKSLSRQVPGSVDVLLKLAYVSLGRRNYAEAEAAFNKILEAHPTEWRALAGLVDNDLAQNRPERASSRLEAELTRSKGSAAVRYLMATTALRSGKYNVAIENFRELANQTPNSIDPQIQLANVYQLKGDIHNAIVTLQNAAVLQPKDPRPGVLLPFLLESENRAQEAKQVARRALAARPKDAVAMNNLAYLLAETGDSLDEAVKLARDAVSQAPTNPVFLDTLGFVYLKRDQNDDALDIFGRLIRRYPNDPACAYHTGMAWYQKGDRARAKTLLSHALELRPPKDIQAGANDLLNRIN